MAFYTHRDYFTYFTMTNYVQVTLNYVTCRIFSMIR